jgi:hypothetical protein
MQKTSVLIPGPQGKWGSYVSKFPPDSGRVLDSMMTAGTRDVITARSGQADKRFGGSIYNPNSLLSAAPLDQYEGVFLNGVRLLLVNDSGTLKSSSGNGIFTTITNGTGFNSQANFEFSTYQSRVYGDNGVDGPVVIDTVTTYGGVTYPVNGARVRPMGVQAPVSAPVAALNVDSTANQVPAGGHTYKVTFVYYNGAEESNGGPASNLVTNDATHTSNLLTSIPIGLYGVTARNIYRDNNDGSWLLIATILDNTTTSYTDRIPAGTTPIPTTNGLPPIFKYITLYLDRLFVIDVTGKNIFWSNAGQPDVWNPVNSITGPNDDIMTAIYVFNGIPWVFGQHTVGVILGNTDGTFFYSPISTTVGCVDNRSIQTRSIISVPTIIWLSAVPNRGIYYSNGSMVQYLSELIEDLASNVSQSLFLTRQNTQNSQAAFQSDTASSSIDLLSNPGTFQTIDPDIEFNLAADWAAGTLINLAQIGNTLSVPVRFLVTDFNSQGTFNGSARQSGSPPVVTLPATSDYSGAYLSDQSGTHEFNSGSANTDAIAEQLFIPQGGTITSLSVDLHVWFVGSAPETTVNLTIWNDLGGIPNTVLYSGPSHLLTGPGSDQLITDSSISVSVASGQKIWIGAVYGDFLSGNYSTISNADRFSVFETANVLVRNRTSTIWGQRFLSSNLVTGMQCGFGFIKTNVAEDGSWTSAPYDTHSTSLTHTTMKLIFENFNDFHSNPSDSGSVNVQGSNDTFTWTTTDTITNPADFFSGTLINLLTGGVYRYWRLVYNVHTATGTGILPAISRSVLTFDNTGNWTSGAITCTSDITSLNALVASITVPSGTSYTLTIATSADNIIYTTFGPIGTAIPQAFAKVRIVMNTDPTGTTYAASGNSVAPTLSQLELDWSVTGTLVSTIIDTGQVPVGWGIFQFSRVGNAGTVQFAFRTAATAGGIPATPWVNISNGQIPTNTVYEFCQWRATMSATADNLPMVNSVTVNWLISQGANLRCASLFFNKSYYLAVASQNLTHNDTLIELDYEGNWRIHRQTIATMSLFFGEAYDGESTSGTILKMFQAITDNGTPITFDLRTKCWNWATPQTGDNIHLKVIRSCKVKGVNTGTLLHMYYSIDRGNNWIEMLNSSGTLGYQTDLSGNQFVEYFIPNFNGLAQISAPNLMFRIVSNDAFPATILTLEPQVYIRKGKFIREEAVVWP